MLSIFRNKRIVLASASPRRKELLERAGLTFSVKTAETEELIDETLPLAEELQRIALEKVDAIPFADSDIVIGADTVVAYKSHVLTKPKTKEEAFNMLNTLSGNTHEVLTAYAIRDISGKVFTRCVSTKVTFFELSPIEINWYIENENVFDKAGAYAIQEKGMLLVKEVQGSYTNIVGLPTECLIRDLTEIIKEVGDK